jgi:hypothetical protein
VAPKWFGDSEGNNGDVNVDEKSERRQAQEILEFNEFLVPRHRLLARTTIPAESSPNKPSVSFVVGMWVFNFRDSNFNLPKIIDDFARRQLRRTDTNHSQDEPGSSINKPPAGWHIKSHPNHHKTPRLPTMDTPTLLPNTPSTSR